MNPMNKRIKKNKKIQKGNFKRRLEISFEFEK